MLTAFAPFSMPQLAADGWRFYKKYDKSLRGKRLKKGVGTR